MVNRQKPAYDQFNNNIMMNLLTKMMMSGRQNRPFVHSIMLYEHRNETQGQIQALRVASERKLPKPMNIFFIINEIFINIGAT